MLSGRLPYRRSFFGNFWARFDAEDMSVITDLADLIQSRRLRWGKDNSIQTDQAQFKPSEPKSGGCTYCWPEKGSIHYKGGRVSRRRLDNPKYSDKFFDDFD